MKKYWESFLGFILDAFTVGAIPECESVESYLSRNGMLAPPPNPCCKLEKPADVPPPKRKKIVLVCGAPQSGKDSIVREFMKGDPFIGGGGPEDFAYIKTCDELKEQASLLKFGDKSEYARLGGTCESYKDRKAFEMEEEGMGPGLFSWREICIWVANKFREEFGPTYWTLKTLDRVLHEFENNSKEVVILTGAGFYDEVECIKEFCEHQNVDLYGVQIVRKGKTYANDSRQWIMDALDWANVYRLVNHEGGMDMTVIRFRHLMCTIFDPS